MTEPRNVSLYCEIYVSNRVFKKVVEKICLRLHCTTAYQHTNETVLVLDIFFFLSQKITFLNGFIQSIDTIV